MTLVLAVGSRDNLWMVTDRRLSYPGGRRPVDDAVKMLSLETLDGVGVLGYAGLGATARGTQPSEWMNDALRARCLGHTVVPGQAYFRHCKPALVVATQCMGGSPRATGSHSSIATLAAVPFWRTLVRV